LFDDSSFNLSLSGIKHLLYLFKTPLLSQVLMAVNTFSTKSELLSQPNDGDGVLKPNKANIMIRNPKNTRPWQHVLDPLLGYLLAIESMLSANLNVFALNFGPEGKSLKVSEVTEIVFSRDELQEKIVEEVVVRSEAEALWAKRHPGAVQRR
jgi:hypothetical protein